MTPSSTSSASTTPTRWETVGAWLHIWTPPKGVDVPPVPWHKLGLAALATLVVLGAAAAIFVPKIDTGKRKGAAERAAAERAADNAERLRLQRDQRLHRLLVRGSTALVPALESAITRDAKRRVAAGTMAGPVVGTRCTAASPAVSRFKGSRVYKCFLATSGDLPGEGSDVLGTGYPFVATIYFNRREVAWCKQNPHADEKGFHGQLHVTVSPVCAGKLSEIL